MTNTKTDTHSIIKHSIKMRPIDFLKFYNSSNNFMLPIFITIEHFPKKVEVLDQ